MKNATSLWNFNPTYSPGDEVWWVGTVIRHGTIIGISFTKQYNSHKQISYTVEEVSGELSRTLEMDQTILYPSKEDLLVFLEKS